jgi:hypothetical protein
MVKQTDTLQKVYEYVLWNHLILNEIDVDYQWNSPIIKAYVTKVFDAVMLTHNGIVNVELTETSRTRRIEYSYSRTKRRLLLVILSKI